MIKRIFTFVTTEFINRGEQEFVEMFASIGSADKDKREELFQKSCEDMLKQFMKLESWRRQLRQVSKWC